MSSTYFPVFVDINNKKATVIGGGNIAFRRIRTLLGFGVQIRVISPVLCSSLEALCMGTDGGSENSVTAELRRYRPGDTAGSDLVIAASDDKAVNRSVWEECRQAGIPVNVIDDRTLCDFYFPSVVIKDEIVVGINSGGADPGKVRETRRKIECLLETESGYYD